MLIILSYFIIQHYRCLSISVSEEKSISNQVKGYAYNFCTFNSRYRIQFFYYFRNTSASNNTRASRI